MIVPIMPPATTLLEEFVDDEGTTCDGSSNSDAFPGCLLIRDPYLWYCRVLMVHRHQYCCDIHHRSRKFSKAAYHSLKVSQTQSSLGPNNLCLLHSFTGPRRQA